MTSDDQKELNERELEDNYPLRFGYLYVADGKVVRASDDSTPAEWKRNKVCVSVKNCDISGRKLWDLMV